MTSMQLAQSPQETIFSFSRSGNATVVTLACPAVREWQASVLSSHLSDVIEQNRGRSVIVDVGGIKQFSCAWINALLGLSDRVARMGGQFVIVGLTRESRRMMRSAGLLKRLRLADTTQEALEMTRDTDVAPWRMAVAKMLAIPVSSPHGHATRRKAA